jgi:hypothetical protein
VRSQGEAWRSRQAVHYYFDPPGESGSVVPFSDPVTQERVQSIAKWMVYREFLETELRRQTVSAKHSTPLTLVFDD